MIRRTDSSLRWLGAVVALLLFPLSAQADDIEPEPYVEEEVAPEPEPEPEPEVEAYVEKEPEPVATRDEPSFGSKLFDCTVLRPFGFAATLVGGVFFLPAALLAFPSGAEGVEVAYEVFVASQVEHTFKRRLGDF
jgi:hypothetical protein